VALLLSQEQVDETVKAIKELSKLPVIFFHLVQKYLSKYADAGIFYEFNELKDVDSYCREHVNGHPLLNSQGLNYFHGICNS